MNPLVSVIVPSYMEEKNIEDCLNAICSQTYQNIEILCIDDNSFDRTFEIIISCQKKDSRIQAFKNPGNGVACARNYGIEKSSGEWIVFVDSDDCLQPQMIEFLLDAAQAESSQIAICAYERNEDFKPILEKNSYSTYSPEQIFISNEMNFASVWAKIFSKQIIEDIFFEKFTVGEDTVFSAEIWRKNGGRKVPYIDIPLYHYKKNNSSTLSNLNAERRKDMVLSRLITSELLKEILPNISFYYLEQALFYIVAYKRKRYEFDKGVKRYFRKVFFKYYRTYFLNRKTSLFDKIYVAVSFTLPTLAMKIYYN